MSLRIIVCVFFICFCLSNAEDQRKAECPPSELTPSCSCKKQEYLTLTCYNLINMWDFVNILHSLEDYDIYELYYRNLNIHFLPKGFLKYLPITSLMLSKSYILGLETDDGEAMFQGAVESIKVFNMHDVQGAKSWRWKAFISLKNLKTLGINSCDLTQITYDFNLFAKSIEIINFSGNQISQIDDKAFDSYEKINFIDLSDNEISIIKRSMFPDPAKNLRTIILSKNKINELPKGIFSNMAALKYLDLSSNKIKWLSLETFDPVYRQLFSLNLKDNNIHCCAAQEWITVPEFQERVQGKCKVPVVLGGKDLSSLMPVDLRHGMC